MSTDPTYADKTALVTGANSGLGFEAAAQLAEAGYGRVILACRSLEKAAGARKSLRDRVGKDVFETVAVDVAELASSRAAAEELVSRGQSVDVLLARGEWQSGRTYTSAPKKMVGPLRAVDEAHIVDEGRQELAWGILEELTVALAV